MTAAETELQLIVDTIPAMVWTGHRPPALALDKNRPPHPRIDLHGVHTSDVTRSEALRTGSEPCSLPLIGSLVHGTRMWRWTTFIPPRHAASAAQRGLFSIRRVQD